MLYTGNFIKTILIVIAQFYWHWYWHMYQYIIIKHVNNSFTVFSSTINIFTRDHTLIKYITVTVINQQFDPLIQEYISCTVEIKSTKSLHSTEFDCHKSANQWLLEDQWGVNTKYAPHLAGQSTCGHSSIQDDVLSCGYGTFVTQQK